MWRTPWWPPATAWTAARPCRPPPRPPNAWWTPSASGKAGLIDTATLLDSQRTLLSLQTSLATARTDQAQALVRLYKSLGGGWSQDDIAVATPAPRPRTTR
jgi:hypothetical protein